MIPTVIAPHPQPLPVNGEGRQSIALAGWGSLGLSNPYLAPVLTTASE